MSSPRKTGDTSVTGNLGGLNLGHRGASALTGAEARHQRIGTRRGPTTLTGRDGRALAGDARVAVSDTIKGATSFTAKAVGKTGDAAAQGVHRALDAQLNGQDDEANPNEIANTVQRAGSSGGRKAVRNKVGGAAKRASGSTGRATGKPGSTGRATGKSGSMGSAKRGGLTVQSKNAKAPKAAAKAGKSAAQTGSAFRGITAGTQGLNRAQQATLMAIRATQATVQAISTAITVIVSAKIWLVVLAVLIVLALLVAILSLIPGFGDQEDNETDTYCDLGGGADVEVVDLPSGSVEGFTEEPLKVAAIISEVSDVNGMNGDDGKIVGLITAMQESQLGTVSGYDTPNGDGDAGYFQQRQLDGWYGSLKQVNDPVYAANAFYNGVTAEDADDYGSAGGGKGHGHIPGLTDVDGWENMSHTEAAQAVQKSAYPDAYAPHVSKARGILDALDDAGTEVNIGDGACSGGNGERVHPAPGYPMTSPFGWRQHPIHGERRLHAGIDYGVPCGEPIYAWSSGTVTVSGVAGGYGNRVEVDHGGGIVSTYSHAQSLSVDVGDEVKGGDEVTINGTTGSSTGCHLHFEIKKDGEYVDPAPYLPNE